MMEFHDVLRRRRMVPRFLDRPVDAGAVDRILECGRRGPSAGFSQGTEFLVLEGSEQTGRYWSATRQADDRADPSRPGVRAAPLVVVPLAHQQAYLDRYAEADKGWTDKDESRWPVPYWLVDASFAAQLIVLAAIDEGLAAAFIGIEHPDRVRREFGVPDGYQPIGTIVAGHPDPAFRLAST